MKNNTGSTKGGAKSHSKKTSGTGSETTNGLNKLFVNELRDIYWAEKALTKAIPKMVRNASSDELKNALEEHLSETEEQVSRLEQVFDSLNEKVSGKKCEAMAGLIKEAELIMSETEEGVVRDAGIISAAQKVEHYEIATYGTLCAFAKTLGEDDALSLLEETLNEEKSADNTLSQIAETSVNAEAAGMEMEEAEEEEEEENEKNED